MIPTTTYHHHNMLPPAGVQVAAFFLTFSAFTFNAFTVCDCTPARSLTVAATPVAAARETRGI